MYYSYHLLFNKKIDTGYCFKTDTVISDPILNIFNITGYRLNGNRFQALFLLQII